MEIIEGRIVVETLMRVEVLLIMLMSAFKDLREKKIDIMYPLACAIISVSWCVYDIAFCGGDFKYIFMSLFPGAIMLILSKLLKIGIGEGDGLMVLLAGPVFGPMLVLTGVTMAFAFSAVAGIFLLIFGRATLKSRMAFLPYLTAGMGVISFAFI
jgi:leader peptidase (prepilin peptidase)/N-methyltransferase